MFETRVSIKLSEDLGANNSVLSNVGEFMLSVLAANGVDTDICQIRRLLEGVIQPIKYHTTEIFGGDKGRMEIIA